MGIDPVTLAIIGIGVQAFGKFQEGRSAKSAADFNARVSQQNAEITRQQTQAALEKQDRERRIRRGQAIAASGASGAGVESFDDLFASSAMQEELDILTLRSQGLLQERNFQTQASMQKAQGKQAMTQGIIGAGSTILTGFSDLGVGAKKPEVINWNQGGQTVLR